MTQLKGHACVHLRCEKLCAVNTVKKRFLTLEEKIKKLKAYKEWLNNESKGVEEAISKFKEIS